VITVKNLHKHFGKLHVLNDISMSVSRGEVFGIVGHSGAGKSTLLRCLNGLESYQQGSVQVMKSEVADLATDGLLELRRHMGMIFQTFNLMARKNVYDNIAFPLRVWKTPKAEIHARVMELLDMVGLAANAKKRLGELSGGEQQRVAIAIGFSNRPKILLADEPTGSVDSATCRQIMDIFCGFNQSLGVTIVIVTHDRMLTKMVNRVVAIRDGKTSSEILVKENLRERLASLTDFEGLETHEEFAVLDRAGRVQIPADFLSRIQLTGNTVKLEFSDGRVTLVKPERE
jgi:D-methionine transport system ATP-binding protein